MARNRKKIVKAVPIRIRWCGRVGRVLFCNRRTGHCFFVEGMTIASGKGAYTDYNLVFNGRTFDVTLNAGGRGLHFCEGLRWIPEERKWIPIPKPPMYLFLIAQGAFETPCSMQLRNIWETESESWASDTVDVNYPLFRRSETNGPLNCWDCRLSRDPCHCEGVDELRRKIRDHRIEIKCKYCVDCQDFYSEESCPDCDSFYIRKSLFGIEPFCPICFQERHLDHCVAVRKGNRNKTCTHSFHLHCIAKWLRGNTKCPICRHDHGLDDDGSDYDP